MAIPIQFQPGDTEAVRLEKLRRMSEQLQQIAASTGSKPSTQTTVSTTTVEISGDGYPPQLGFAGL